jgi:hypothetical protein
VFCAGTTAESIGCKIQGENFQEEIRMATKKKAKKKAAKKH